MAESNKKIENMNREELRDLLLTLSEKMNSYLRAGRKNFEIALSMDKKKEAVEERLAELEDWSNKKPKNVILREEHH